MPAVALAERVKYAIAGVGTGPNKTKSMPADEIPASGADSKLYPETRVPLPISQSSYASPYQKPSLI